MQPLKLHFKTYGSGRPVVILHGLLGMSDNWSTIARSLADQFLVFTVDLRNHGRSPHSEAFSYRSMVEDLRLFMEEQWLFEGAIVIGHSMGGKVAMQLAFDYPDLVQHLVVVDIAPISYPSSHDLILEVLSSIKLDDHDSRGSVAEEMLAQLQDERVVQFLLKNLRREKEKYTWRMNLPVIRREYQAGLAAPDPGASFEGATLFLRGGQSDYILPQHEPIIRSHFPSAKIQTIAASGHWIHADSPAPFLQAVRDFVDG